MRHGLDKKNRKRTTNSILNEWRIKKFFFFFFLALSYGAYPYIAVHCSNVGKKIYLYHHYCSTFFIYSGAKNSFLAPLLWML